MKNLVMCASVRDADAQSDAQLFHGNAAFEWSSRLAITIFSSLPHCSLSRTNKRTPRERAREGGTRTGKKINK